MCHAAKVLFPGGAAVFIPGRGVFAGRDWVENLPL